MYALDMAEAVRMLLRLPPDLHAVLVERARLNERSLHGQIVYLLRRALAADL
jgi:hypothetical protein